MAAGGSVSGGIGGMFYFILMMVALVNRYHRQLGKRSPNGKYIFPIVLSLVFSTVILINLNGNHIIDLRMIFSSAVYRMMQIISQDLGHTLMARASMIL